MANEELILSELRNIREAQDRDRRAAEGRHDELAGDIHKIKEAVYNPDTGLFARVQANTSFRRVAIWILALLASTLLPVVWAVFIK